jgi:hypothetical protein
VNDIESRLRDLRRATEHQLRPAPDLLARIERSGAPRTWQRWPQLIAVAALAAVVLVIAVLPGGRDDVRVVSRPPTQAEYLEAMNQRCDEYVLETAEVRVIFPTPEAYRLAAENRIAALARSLERFETIGAPPGAAQLLQQVSAEATSAQVAAQAALEAAQVRDPALAGAAMAEVDAAVNRVGDLLADYGAERCRPSRAP